MYIWLMVNAIIAKSPPHPESQQDMLQVNIKLALSIAILLVIVSFVLGAIVSWMIILRKRSIYTVSEAKTLLISDQPQNVLVPSFAKRSFEGVSTHSMGQNDPPVVAQTVKEGLLGNEHWLRLAEECTGLFDELERIAPNVDPPRQEMIRHSKYRLQEILTRSGVELISGDSGYDRHRHQLEPPNFDIPSGTPITEIVSPGFAVGRRVLRPAHVRVATTLQAQ